MKITGSYNFICVCVLCMQMHVLVCMHVVIRGSYYISFSITFYLTALSWSLTELETTDLASLADQSTVRICVSLLPNTGVTGMHSHVGLFMSDLDLNSSPHVFIRAIAH